MLLLGFPPHHVHLRPELFQLRPETVQLNTRSALRRCKQTETERCGSAKSTLWSSEDRTREVQVSVETDIKVSGAKDRYRKVQVSEICSLLLKTEPERCRSAKSALWSVKDRDRKVQVSEVCHLVS